MARNRFLRLSLKVSFIFCLCALLVHSCAKPSPTPARMDVNLPNPPADVKATVSFQNGDQITGLTWTDKSDNEEGFKIKARAREESDYAVIATADKDQTSFVDTNTPSNKTYYYRVSSFNADGEAPSAWEGLRLGLLSKIERRNIHDYEQSGGLLYLLWQEGLTPINISDPAKPRAARTFPLKGFVNRGFINLSGENLFIIDDQKLFVMSIKNPLNPSFLSALDVGDTVDMKHRENTVYLLKEDGLLDIIDVRVLRKPVLKGFIKIEGNPRNILLADNHLFAANEREGIFVYSLANPYKPIFKGKFAPRPAKFYGAISLWNGSFVASVRDFENELHIIDPTDPLNMKIVGTCRTEWIPTSVASSNKILIVPQTDHGAEIMLANDPKNIRTIGYVQPEINKAKAFESFIVMSGRNVLYLFSVP